MAAKKHHAKKHHVGHIVAPKAVTRKRGFMYFVDAAGNVRETKMSRKGGKKGRKVCRK